MLLLGCQRGRSSKIGIELEGECVYLRRTFISGNGQSKPIIDRIGPRTVLRTEVKLRTHTTLASGGRAYLLRIHRPADRHN